MTWTQVRDHVLGNPGFVAFATIMHGKVCEGASAEVFAMLSSLGAPGITVHEILEGWPRTESEQRAPTEAGFTPLQEAACRLAHFIDDLDLYDWPSVMLAAVHAGAGTGK